MRSTDDGQALAFAVVDTVRDSLLVLDEKLNVVAASRSFYSTFKTSAEETVGRRIYDLGAGEWNISALRQLLERIVPEHGVMDNFEIEQNFTHLGKRTMLLNARKVFYHGDANTTLLLAIEDVSVRRYTERLLKSLSDQKDTLLSEMSHRVANSLQIIASILLLKARSVQSTESREHLEDAHRRVQSVATLQKQLKGTANGEKIDLSEYLTRLCETLSGSMISDKRTLSLKVKAENSFVLSDQAVSFGLVVTELVINAFKHAFPEHSPEDEIDVVYSETPSSWVLSVQDNGCGMPDSVPEKSAGLGTAIVNAIAQQLGAKVEVVSTAKGTSVSLIHNDAVTL